MRRNRALPSRVACAAILCGAFVFSGCTTEDEIYTEGTAQGQVSLQFLTEADVTQNGVVAAEDLVRFYVADAVAAHWAQRYVTDTGSFEQPVHSCFSYPVRDADGALAARGYVFTSVEQCQSFATLVQQAQDVWRSVGLGVASELDNYFLQRAVQQSAGGFYTVEVSVHSFRHPLREAYAGLPEWVLRVALQWPEGLNDSCLPRSKMLDEANAQQIIRYACGEPKGELVYAHDAGQRLDLSELAARYQPVAAYTRLRTTLAEGYSLAGLENRLFEMRELWTRYLVDFTGQGE